MAFALAEDPPAGAVVVDEEGRERNKSRFEQNGTHDQARGSSVGVGFPACEEPAE